MKNKILLVGGGLLCYLLFLLAQLPADRLLARLPLPPALQLDGVQGTVWQGRVDTVRWQRYSLHAVRWELLVSHLLRLEPAVALKFEDRNGLLGEAQVAWQQGVVLRDVQLQADAGWLVMQSPAPLPVVPAGTLTWRDGALTVTPQGVCQSLAGRLIWQGAGVTSPFGSLDLDTVQAQLSCAKGRWQAEVKQSSTQLRTEGRAEIGNQGDYQVDAKLFPASSLAAAYRQGIEMIGPRDSQGAVRLKQSGRL